MTQNVLPRWRGFNLLDMFTMKDTEGRFQETDFQMISDFGFDFVRLPLCYTLWTKSPAWEHIYDIEEGAIARVDEAVELGQKYGIHVNISFHRGPGYSVNGERQEPYVLWKDEEALKAFQYHWAYFARRYRGISNSKVSFNLINEPTSEDGILTHSSHERVMRSTIETIRREDKERLIILDGMSWGNEPLPELADLAKDGVAFSTRAYVPMNVTHYMASWVEGSDRIPPQWPEGGREELFRHYERWAQLASDASIGVHCGEGGAYNKTPHKVVLSWMEDVQSILKGFNIGYAQWNFRGPFGILDSGRSDVAYEEYKGHQLDRKMLELLRK